jgi:hypothetical protein
MQSVIPGQDIDMPLNDADRAWVREAIRTAHERRGLGKLTGAVKDWGGTGAAVAILIFFILQWGGYVEFKTATNLKLDHIYKVLDAIQEKQNLTEITARVASIQAQGGIPPQHVVKELDTASKIVISAIDKYPQYSEAWRAASSLVNIRSITPEESNIPQDIAAKVGPPIPNQGDCFTIPIESHLAPMPPELANHIWMLHVSLWHDCTLYLDNLDGFKNSTLTHYMQDKIGSMRETVYLDLTLVRVNVVYRGGQIIPATRLIFYGCAFHFDVPESPPDRGKDLMQAFLSKDYQDRNLEITIPAA